MQGPTGTGPTLRAADAIVVLGGRTDRVPVGRALWEQGVAPTLVVFNATGTGEGEHVYLRPEPHSTRGEARAAAALAAERGWRSLVVVTSRYHVRRARMIFRRAWDGELRMVASPSPTWRLPFDLALELVKAIYAVAILRSP